MEISPPNVIQSQVQVIIQFWALSQWLVSICKSVAASAPPEACEFELLFAIFHFFSRREHTKLLVYLGQVNSHVASVITSLVVVVAFLVVAFLVVALLVVVEGLGINSRPPLV